MNLNPPERVTVTTCIGCGAMSVPGTCPGTCSDERKLELVPASDYDEAQIQGDAAAAGIDKLRPLLETVAGADGADPAHALRDLAAPARAALRDAPSIPVAAEEDEEIDSVVAWWCARCGGIDAPQPCIGVCISRPVEWASLQSFEGERDRRARLVDELREVTDVVRPLGFVTPRPGQEERNWRALQARARRALNALDPVLS
jgi:hypothetical protein